MEAAPLARAQGGPEGVRTSLVRAGAIVTGLSATEDQGPRDGPGFRRFSPPRTAVRVHPQGRRRALPLLVSGARLTGGDRAGLGRHCAGPWSKEGMHKPCALLLTRELRESPGTEPRTGAQGLGRSRGQAPGPSNTGQMGDRASVALAKWGSVNPRAFHPSSWACGALGFPYPNLHSTDRDTEAQRRGMQAQSHGRR